MPHLSLYLFGPPRLELDGSPLMMDRNKAVALLAYLAVTRGSHTRETLATLFWPDYDQSRSYAYLRRSLWTLNDALGGGWLETNRELVSLPPNPNFFLDIERFHTLLAQRRKVEDPKNNPENAASCADSIPLLTEAVSLYQADFMAGFSLRDCPGFDDWQFFQSENLRREYALALHDLVSCHSAAGDYEQAIGYARRWLVLDSLEEEAHRHLMIAYSSAGQRSAAIRQYHECERVLQDQLGVSPQPETQALYQQILSGTLPSPPFVENSGGAGAPSRREQSEDSLGNETPGDCTPPVHLPVPPSPFVGRTAELEEISALLKNEDCHLLTLQGPGGVGKTRLALHTGGQAVCWKNEAGDYVFSHGVYFVPLASLSSPDALVAAVADTIGLHFQTPVRFDISVKKPSQQLIDYLRGKQLLLVLDNFEHLIPGASLLAEITAEAPGVKMLVTTRERLNLYGEWVLDVLGMSYPDYIENPEEAEWASYSAIDLFVKCARRALTSFSLQPGDLPHIIRICQMVEGMPLGIELASSWVRLLPVSEIAAEIERSLDFLTSSLRDIPERHSSLRVVFDQSWALLTPGEQNVLQQLSIFRGSFSRAAAAAVAGASLPLLSALVDKSLLYLLSTTGTGLAGRYEMHELIKQYAAQKLEESPALAESTRSKHAAIYAQQMEDLFNRLHGKEQQAAIDTMEAELDDIHSAWNYAAASANIQQLRMAVLALISFYTITGRYQEGAYLFEPTLDILRKLRTQAISKDWQLEGLYALLLSVQPRFSDTSDTPQGIANIKECLSLAASEEMEAERPFIYTFVQFGAGILKGDQVFDLYQQTVEGCKKYGYRWMMATAMLTFGHYLEDFEGNDELVQHLLRAAWRLYQEMEDSWGCAACLDGLASTALHTGRYHEAMSYGLESLSIYRSRNDRWRIIGSLVNLGHVYTATGSYQEALERFSESMEISKELGHRHLMSIHHDSMGYIHLLLGDFQKAEAEYQHSMSLYQIIGNPFGIGMALTNLGDIARLKGRYDDARQYYLEALGKFKIITLYTAWKQWGLSIAHKKLGIVATQTGDFQAASNYLIEGMREAWEIERIPEVLDIFISQAELFHKQGQVEKAIELLSIAGFHPAASKESQTRALSLLGEITASLPGDMVELAIHQGKSKSVESMVAAFLTGQDLSDLGSP